VSSRRIQLLAAVPALVTGAVLLVLPLLAPTSYDLSVFTTFCANLILLVGLNLISGYGGQLSLGQAAFYGLGAYTITIGTNKLSLDPRLCFVLAPIVTAAFAIAVGIPSLRLRGLYFAMATLGVGVIFQLFLDRAATVTGGPNGVGVAPLRALGFDFGQPRTTYIGAAVFALCGVVGSQLFLRTRTGWGLRAAHASEPAASVVGVDIFRVRLIALGISGAYAGVAGAIQAFNSLYVSPTTFNFFFSVMLFIVLTIGGMATWAGPLFGAGLLLLFDRWLTAYSDKMPLILAAIFLLALRLFPRGIADSAAAGVRLARMRIARTRGNAARIGDSEAA
jgi:branched-chain amino acid transport system permease protein